MDEFPMTCFNYWPNNLFWPTGSNTSTGIHEQSLLKVQCIVLFKGSLIHLRFVKWWIPRMLTWEYRGTRDVICKTASCYQNKREELLTVIWDEYWIQVHKYRRNSKYRHSWKYYVNFVSGHKRAKFSIITWKQVYQCQCFLLWQAWK